MNLPDKSRCFGEFITDSLRIKDNTIVDFINGPTLTYNGSFELFNLAEIDAFTVTVTLRGDYSKINISDTNNGEFATINVVNGPQIVKPIRDIRIISTSSVSFITHDKDQFTISGERDNEIVSVTISANIVEASNHSIYSSALSKGLSTGTLIDTSGSYESAVELAREHPTSLVIVQPQTYTINTLFDESTDSILFRSFPVKINDNTICAFGHNSDCVITYDGTTPTRNIYTLNRAYAYPGFCANTENAKYIRFIGGTRHQSFMSTRGIYIKTEPDGEYNQYTVYANPSDGLVFYHSDSEKQQLIFVANNIVRYIDLTTVQPWSVSEHTLNWDSYDLTCEIKDGEGYLIWAAPNGWYYINTPTDVTWKSRTLKLSITQLKSEFIDYDLDYILDLGENLLATSHESNSPTLYSVVVLNQEGTVTPTNITEITNPDFKPNLVNNRALLVNESNYYIATDSTNTIFSKITNVIIPKEIFDDTTYRYNESTVIGNKNIYTVSVDQNATHFIVSNNEGEISEISIPTPSTTTQSRTLPIPVTLPRTNKPTIDRLANIRARYKK